MESLVGSRQGSVLDIVVLNQAEMDCRLVRFGQKRRFLVVDLRLWIALVIFYDV